MLLDMTSGGCIKQQIGLVCLFVCLPGFFLLAEIKIHPFKLAVGCGSVWPHLEGWLGFKLGWKCEKGDVLKSYEVSTRLTQSNLSHTQALDSDCQEHRKQLLTCSNM